MRQPAQLPLSAFNDERGQWDACRVRVRAKAGEFVLGITGEDLYTPGRPEERYCLGMKFQSGGVAYAAVISSYNLGPQPAERLEKLALRYVLQGALRPQTRG